MVSFEMQYDLIEYIRTYYTILDFFSDIGGLQSILMTFFTVGLSLINQNKVEDFLAHRLFVISP